MRVATPRRGLGHAAAATGAFEQAKEYYLRCLKISQKAGFLWGIEKSSKYLGMVALSMGQISEAERYLLQSLRISEEIGLVRDKLNLLYEYACLVVKLDKPEQAVELLGVILQHPASHQIRLGEGRIRDSAIDLLAEIKAGLPPQVYSIALERGQELDIDGVIFKLAGPKNRKNKDF